MASHRCEWSLGVGEMLGGRVLRVLARVLPLALVVGLFGASQSESAGALGPAILLSITVAPAVTTITQGATQQFTATGTYSDLSTKNLTDTVTWSSSSSSTATVSNAHGSQGLATGVGTGVATITASDPATPLPGTAALTVTPALPIPTTTTLPTVPTTLPTSVGTGHLVSVTVTPPVANVAVGAGEQFTATGDLLGPEHSGPHRFRDVVLVVVEHRHGVEHSRFAGPRHRRRRRGGDHHRHRPRRADLGHGRAHGDADPAAARRPRLGHRGTGGRQRRGGCR